MGACSLSLLCVAHQSSMSDDKRSSSMGAADSHMVDETQKSQLDTQHMSLPANEPQDAASTRFISSCHCDMLVAFLGVWLATCLIIFALDAWFLRHGMIDERRTWISTVDERRPWARWVALRWASIYFTAWEALYALWGTFCALLACLTGTGEERDSWDPALRTTRARIEIAFTLAFLFEVLGVVLHFCGLLDRHTGRPPYFAGVYGMCKTVSRGVVVLLLAAGSFVGFMDFLAYCRGTPRWLFVGSEARKEL